MNKNADDMAIYENKTKENQMIKLISTNHIIEPDDRIILNFENYIVSVYNKKVVIENENGESMLLTKEHLQDLFRSF